MKDFRLKFNELLASKKRAAVQLDVQQSSSIKALFSSSTSQHDNANTASSSTSGGIGLARLRSSYISATSTSTMVVPPRDRDRENNRNLSQEEQQQKQLDELLAKEFIDLYNRPEQLLTIQILRKKVKSPIESNFLKNVLKNLSVFKQNPEVFTDLSAASNFARQLKHEFFPRRTVLFNYGDIGTKYHVILKGTVYFLIPNQDLSIEEKYNIRDHKPTFSATNHNTISPEQEQLMAKANQAKDKTLQLLTKLGAKTEFLQQISQEQHMTDDEFLQTKFPNFLVVRTSGPGDSFGEIALLTNKGRSAAVVCKDDCDFMSLTRDGFEKVFSLYKKRIIDESIRFLQQYSFLKQLSNYSLLGLMYSMKQLTFTMNQYIYRESSDSPCDALFLVKSGEVVLSKTIPQKKSKSTSAIKPVTCQMLTEAVAAKASGLTALRADYAVPKSTQFSKLGPASYFGEYEITKNLPVRQMSAVCSSITCLVYVVEKTKLKQLLEPDEFVALCKESQSRFDFLKSRHEISVEILESKPQPRSTSRTKREIESDAHKKKLIKIINKSTNILPNPSTPLPAPSLIQPTTSTSLLIPPATGTSSSSSSHTFSAGSVPGTTSTSTSPQKIQSPARTSPEKLKLNQQQSYSNLGATGLVYLFPPKTYEKYTTPQQRLQQLLPKCLLKSINESINDNTNSTSQTKTKSNQKAQQIPQSVLNRSTTGIHAGDNEPPATHVFRSRYSISPGLDPSRNQRCITVNSLRSARITKSMQLIKRIQEAEASGTWNRSPATFTSISSQQFDDILKLNSCKEFTEDIALSKQKVTHSKSQHEHQSVSSSPQQQLIKERLNRSKNNSIDFLRSPKIISHSTGRFERQRHPVPPVASVPLSQRSSMNSSLIISTYNHKQNFFNNNSNNNNNNNNNNTNNNNFNNTKYSNDSTQSIVPAFITSNIKSHPSIPTTANIPTTSSRTHRKFFASISNIATPAEPQ